MLEPDHPLAHPGRGGALVSALAGGAIVAATALAVLLALDWSVTGLLHLPAALFLVGGALALAGALAAGGWMTRCAYAAERQLPTPGHR